MGDINLLGMIRKIKNSLSGFVSTSDKATKSKFGIVKVGDNLSVSSGTISVPVATEETYGVVKAGSGGITVDLLFSGNLVNGASTVHELAHPYTDYKALILCYGSGVNMNSGDILVCDAIQTGNLNSNNVNCGSLSALRFDSEDATKFTIPNGTGTVVGVRIYGIK